MMKVALVGNPNSGKTTLYNKLTKSRSRVGNWAGVTVERKDGKFHYKNHLVNVTDLPGIYSLSPYSQEEVISRNFIFDERPDVIVNIVDATNLERNLYLTSQLLETNTKVIVALNMIDVLEESKKHIDVKELEKSLGCKVIPISASKNINITVLIDEIVSGDYPMPASSILESSYLYKYIAEINYITNFDTLISTKLLEDDIEAQKFVKKRLDEDTVDNINEVVQNAKNYFKEPMDMVIADERYKNIVSLCKKVLTVDDTNKETITDKVDKILTHKFFAIPIFLLCMYLVFAVTFGPIGTFLLESAEYLVDDVILTFVENTLNALNASDWVISLFTEGIIPGVGMILTFLPQILILFLFLTILEDSGYMARAAFIMDNFLRRFGLSGKAFVPMLMGFGCTVPAIMATRTLESERDRRLAIILTPFMSCGARLQVYIVFAAIFFPNNTSFVVFSLYILGIIVAILSGLLLKVTVLKGEVETFIMELPPYRMPSFKNLVLNLWDKAKGFIYKAGTILLVAAIFIWVLQRFTFDFTMTSSADESILASIGKFIAPVFTPLGFGEWRATVSLLTGLIAKEAVISSLSILYTATESLDATKELTIALSQNFTRASSLSYMTFVLLYTPCVVAFATTKREMASWKWTMFTVGYQTVVAYIFSFIVYEISLLFF